VREREGEGAQNLASSRATEPKSHGAYLFFNPAARKSLLEYKIRSDSCDSMSHNSRCDSFATEDYSICMCIHTYTFTSIHIHICILEKGGGRSRERIVYTCIACYMCYVFVIYV